jgi:hypothetical protein
MIHFREPVAMIRTMPHAATAADQSVLSDPFAGSSGERALFLLLPAIAMSLGWGLRGTIGGGQIGAMIPGAIVSLCLCHLLGWSRSVGIAAAFGAVGVGLGGQETYGQTIGFLRSGPTVPWGLLGLTIKGAQWGLAGGVFVGLGLMLEKYRRREIAVGLVLLILGTALANTFIDQPKLLYFSNRLDKPREEVWAGLTAGALCLVGWLAILRRERVSIAFAGWGLVAGGLGFGLGGVFIATGFVLPLPYKHWSWWKVMEFTFGLLFGLGLGVAGYRSRGALRRQHAEAPAQRPDALAGVSATGQFLAGLALAAGGLWLQFTVPYRAIFTLVGAGLIGAALVSDMLAWHVALSMTIIGFCRDFLNESVKRTWIEPEYAGWGGVLIVAVGVVALVWRAGRRGRLDVPCALLGMTWLSTAFGLIKMTAAAGNEMYFVPTVFVLEAVVTTLLVLSVTRRRAGGMRAETTLPQAGRLA